MAFENERYVSVHLKKPAPSNILFIISYTVIINMDASATANVSVMVNISQ